MVSRPYQDEPQLFRVHCGNYRDRENKKSFVVEAWAFSWTGTELVQEYYNFTIREFERYQEEMTITDLPCFPVQFYKNRDGAYGAEAVEALKADLLVRGKVFRELCRESVYGRQHTYDGELLTDDPTYLSEVKGYNRNKKQTASTLLMDLKPITDAFADQRRHHDRFHSLQAI